MAEPKIYLDLPPELRQVLNDSGLTVADVLRREGVELPLNIREAELPAAVAGEREKNIGMVLTDPTFLLSLSAAVAMVILALSKFLKDREHAPRLVETYVEKEITGADGKHRKILVLEKQFIQPHTALNAVELETQLGLKDGMVVKFRTEDSRCRSGKSTSVARHFPSSWRCCRAHPVPELRLLPGLRPTNQHLARLPGSPAA